MNYDYVRELYEQYSWSDTVTTYDLDKEKENKDADSNRESAK